MSTVPSQTTSAATHRANLSPASREIRLGLVIYGGVSLAIYINGVAQEFFRAVRGRGLYRLVKRLCDSDIVIDIISGTSAGGVNGVLLSYALANEREFADTASLWREHGGLDALMHDPSDKDVTSLLDSRGYYIPRIEDALRGMKPIDSAVQATEAASTTEELDLFVTGTDFDGRLSTEMDSTGRLIDIKSHETVFQLKHRAGRKLPFETADGAQGAARLKALAKLSAITSCFPLAFEPVHVKAVLNGQKQDDPDFWLTQWGQLTTQTWFLDGGVLDNKPFSYTIGQIFERTATRPVDRKLFYVEPDPERFDPTNQRLRDKQPHLGAVTRDALVGIPGYESIAEDLRQIVKRNEHIAQLSRLDPIIRHAQRTAGDPEPVSATTAQLYAQVRFIQLSDRVIRGLLRNMGMQQDLCSEERRDQTRSRERQNRRSARALRSAFDHWEGDGAQTLRRFDVYFQLRRLYHVIYAVAADVEAANLELRGNPDASALREKLAGLRSLWGELNLFLEELLILRWAMETLVDNFPPNLLGDPETQATKIWARVEKAYETLLHVEDAGQVAELRPRPAFSSTDLRNLHKELNVRMSQMQGLRAATIAMAADNPGAFTLESTPPPTLIQHVQTCIEKFLGQPACRPYLDAWRRFESVDAFLFPIDFFANVGEKDEIDIVRISPVDANKGFCRQALEDKVAGEKIMHFSAFLKRSWRSNDILWGRLDGSCRLFECLLQPDKVVASVRNRDVRDLLRGELAEVSAHKMFPHSPKNVCDRLDAWLALLADPDQQRSEAAARDPAQYDLLLDSAHLEIIAEAMQDVYEDVTFEQLTWNGHWGMDNTPAPPFRHSYERWDSSLFLGCSKEWTRGYMESLKNNRDASNDPRQTPLATHFVNNYKVGSETAGKHIPPAVLFELMTRTLLVARNCMIGAFPPDMAERISSSVAYRLFLSAPLRLAHTLAVFARRERVFFTAALAALTVYALGALFVALMWDETWRDAEGKVNSTAAWGLIGIPLLILGPVMYGAWLKATARFRGRRVGIGIIKLLGFTVAFAAVALVLSALFASWPVIVDKLADRASRWLPTIAHRQWESVAHVTLVAMLIVLTFGLPRVGLHVRRLGRWLGRTVTGGQ